MAYLDVSILAYLRMAPNWGKHLRAEYAKTGKVAAIFVRQLARKKGGNSKYGMDRLSKETLDTCPYQHLATSIGFVGSRSFYSICLTWISTTLAILPKHHTVQT